MVSQPLKPYEMETKKNSIPKFLKLFPVRLLIIVTIYQKKQQQKWAIMHKIIKFCTTRTTESKKNFRYNNPPQN